MAYRKKAVSEQEKKRIVKRFLTGILGIADDGLLKRLEEKAELIELKKYAVLPMPAVTLTREDEKAIAAIQAELSPYAETAMARFVTGDVPLDDEQWELFCRNAEEKGLNEMIAIWQKYVQ